MIDRITILGGSSVYIPEFIMSVVSRNLKVRQIALFGPAGDKLTVVADFCRRLLRKSGFPTEIIASSDLAEAVTGAKYILNHVRVGGMEARTRDERVPPKYGMIGHDTLGAGGFANAMRTVPVVLQHAAIIEAVNPDATFINLTNPMGIVVEALIKYSKLRVIGVTELPNSYILKVARLLGSNPDDLVVDYLGLNHLGWIQDIKVQGRSKMSQLLEILEPHQEDGFDYDLIDLFRMIPTRNTGTYFHQGEILKAQKTGSRFRAEILHEAEKRILKLYKDPSLTDIPELTRERNAVWYDQTIVPLINALENTKEHNIIVCMQNGKCIRDLPEDSSVELPAVVSNKGVVPRKVGSTPRFLLGLYMAAKESDRLTVEAVRHHSFEYALQSLTINPFVPSYEAATAFLQRIIKDEQLELH
jgi:6-phospho-beta-glucosidase